LLQEILRIPPLVLDQLKYASTFLPLMFPFCGKKSKLLDNSKSLEELKKCGYANIFTQI